MGLKASLMNMVTYVLLFLPASEDECGKWLLSPALGNSANLEKFGRRRPASQVCPQSRKTLNRYLATLHLEYCRSNVFIALVKYVLETLV